MKSSYRALGLSCLWLAATLAAVSTQAQQETVRIKVDASGASTRVVLTHSTRVPYEIRAEDDRLEIVYPGPVRADPPDLLLDDPILSRFRLDGDRRIVFFTGIGYRRYDSFELRNPFRLVIDLQGLRENGPTIAPMPSRRDPSRKLIVLDPGHGGIEKGAEGPSGLLEKDVTLDLARRLRRALERDGPLSVVLTRDEDRLVGLEERSAIANYNRADLFVSIHLNYSGRSKARGAETYFLSTSATDDEARTTAALENRSSGVSEQLVLTVDGEQRDLDLVLWDLAQNQYLAESSVLAENMQQQLNELTGTRNRGVRQAHFRVLMGATMPAILVEVGFISNREEEARFRDSSYRDKVVTAMANAVYGFLGDLERLSGPSLSGATGPGTP